MSIVDTGLYELVRRAVRDELRASGPPVAAEPEPDLVKLGQVKRYVQVSASTLKKWIREGALPKYGRGRVVLVRLADVRAALKRKEPKAIQVASDVQRILASVPGGRR